MSSDERNAERRFVQPIKPDVIRAIATRPPFLDPMEAHAERERERDRKAVEREYAADVLRDQEEA